MKTKIKYKYHLPFTITQQNKISCKSIKMHKGLICQLAKYEKNKI